MCSIYAKLSKATQLLLQISSSNILKICGKEVSVSFIFSLRHANTLEYSPFSKGCQIHFNALVELHRVMPAALSLSIVTMRLQSDVTYSWLLQIIAQHFTLPGETERTVCLCAACCARKWEWGIEWLCLTHCTDDPTSEQRRVKP